ncbi:hypothetical protein PPL_06313 [Heterostelium album PN500]|uniref:UDP-glucose 4-epimerase n=1 Tax=Heterostelium pallidum (strain ATCC 26659 / Pp 5 / PN500) TaxID=670386 RepID=D3BCT5_HETP5|nr:hypothetical protein PPL_06313 [Heterostelium album PN500]EFA80727.1 hypothetical protein PPL_06313 [Heterostelium album PN500]|eukprot:XP_020432847.1 hypothetical protein PPL_06313 [Heterostelium album PN500]
MQNIGSETSKGYVLVTGGAGYIGSHTVVELINANYVPIVIDNLNNGYVEALNRIEVITGFRVEFHKIDLMNEVALSQLFDIRPITMVIHFAGYKSVTESVSKPLSYYDNNITGTLNLLKVMQAHNVKNIVFSSSANVYGNAETVPITEDLRHAATNPYGRTKMFVEAILKDQCISDAEWNCILLRYFNPVGAHPSGLIGEDPHDIPNNLVPYITQTAIGKREFLSVFGGDYETPDGTGIRDFIHVVDLARGHIAALDHISKNPGCVAYNLGTGRGYSVLEMVAAIGRAAGKDVPYKIVDRRPGDIGVSYADPSKAQRELGWKAVYNQNDMCEHAWKWQSMNPNGYRDAINNELYGAFRIH